MWVITKDGSYSAVQNPDNTFGFLTVRTWNHGDAKRLMDWLASRRYYAAIDQTLDGDYAYRLQVPTTAFGQYVMECVVNIDYPGIAVTITMQSDGTTQ